MAINRDKVLEAAQKYVEKKKYDKAVVELRKLIEADPNDARTLLKIGDLQAKQSLHADAINTYESVGKLYSHQGFALKAIAVYKQIGEIIAKHVPQLEERYGHITPKLAELYQQLGLTSDALAALDQVATRLQRQQRDQEAIEVFRKIVELDPTNPLPHLRLAEALSRVKDVDGAVFEFKTAASQLAGIGRRDDALKVLERLLHHKQDAEQAKVCAELYLSRGQQQDGMQALAKLQVCFQANPRDFDTLALLARAFNAIGQGAKAIEVQKEMARVARDSGKTDLFREIVERLLRVAPHDEGVKRLATQTSSVAPGGYPSGAPLGASQAPPAYPQVPPNPPPQVMAAPVPPAIPQPPARPAPMNVPTTSQPFEPFAGRQVQAPLQRPMTADMMAIANPALFGRGQPQPEVPRPPQFPEPAASHDDADAEADEVEEVSYSQYEEVDPEEIVEEEADAGYVQAAADAYAEGQYDDGNAYALDDGGAVVESEEGVDLSEDVQKALADANAFRRVRLYNKALETLRVGLEIDPRSMDLHEVYRDILIESGQNDEAVQSMLVIATLYVDALDGDSAARALQDVLAFDPHNARALEMLQELGYEVVDEEEGAADGESSETITSTDQEAYAEAARELPAYDFEQGGGEYAEPSLETDELAPGELPSFPLDDPSAGAYVLDESEYGDTEAEPLPVVDNGPSIAPPTMVQESPFTPSGPDPAPLSQAPARMPSIGAAASQELEDALDEAEFFCSRGLYEDARAILTEQLTRHPKNPLLNERLAEIDAQFEQQRGSGSGTREKPRDADRSFDIAASLDALESLGDYGGVSDNAAFEEPNQQVDVEEVFAKFKEGVAKQISVDDSGSHYDLGIAYKEMMLLDDAIREFETAARDPKRECVCRSMIGMIQIERGNVNEAIEAFLEGLNASLKDPQQETVLCYEIGAAYEVKKMNKEALTYYQKAMRRDPNYRDVQERVRRLAKAEPKTPLRQVAVGADDEFDRAFDDLLGKA